MSIIAALLTYSILAATPAGVPISTAPTRAWGVPTTGPATAPAATVPAAPAEAAWKVGSTVEVKWGGAWRAGVIKEFDGNFYKVVYDNMDTLAEWVQPERLREVGSKKDIPMAMPTPPGQKPALPGAPGAAPGFPGMPGQPGEPAATGAKSVNRGPGPWTYVADPAPVIKTTSEAIKLAGGGTSMFDHPLSLHVATKAPIAVVVYIDETPNAPKPQRVERLNLETGKSMAVLTLPAGTTFGGLSPDGTRGVLIAHGSVKVVDLSGAEVKEIITFAPPSNMFKGDVAYASMVDNTHVVTRLADLILWDISKSTAIWTMPIDGMSNPIVTAGGKYFIAHFGIEAAVFEALTGNSAGTPPDAELRGQGAVPHPDGKRIAMIAGDHVRLVSMDGKGSKSIYLPSFAWGNDAVWVGEDYLLLKGIFLLDTRSGAVVWQYNPVVRSLLGSGAGGTWMVDYSTAAARGGKLEGRLRPLKLPDDAAAKRIAAGNVDDLFTVKAGTKVSLEVRMTGDAATKAAANMKAQMAARGWVLADGEPLKLEAVDNAIGTRQVTYQNMGQAAQATITDHQYTVQLKQNDQVIWHVTKTYGGPAVLQVKAGQTLEGVLAQDAKESLAWFDQVEIPERFQTNKTPVGFGTSDLVGP